MAKRSDRPKSAEDAGVPLIMHGPAIRGNPDFLRSLLPILPVEPEPEIKASKARRGRFSAAEITRAIKAVIKAGQSVTGTEIAADGTLRILHGEAAAGSSSEYDRWRSRRDARPS